MASSYVHRESENGIIIFWFKITCMRAKCLQNLPIYIVCTYKNMNAYISLGKIAFEPRDYKTFEIEGSAFFYI